MEHVYKLQHGIWYQYCYIQKILFNVDSSELTLKQIKFLHLGYYKFYNYLKNFLFYRDYIQSFQKVLFS